MRSRRLLKLLHVYPPFLGAGIRITRMTPDLREIDVEMKLRWWNSNFVGTHYGGSLYSMADPFYMLMLIDNLGRDYVVWDKAASIRFRKPGRGTVRAEFRLTQLQLGELRAQIDAQGKIEPKFVVQIRDQSGDVVAEVEKLLHIRRRDAGQVMQQPAPSVP
jgi:hypothetical protein